MVEDNTTQCLLFSEIFAKPTVLQFDQRNGSSDGGAILLKAAERCYGSIFGRGRSTSLLGCALGPFKFNDLLCEGAEVY